MLMIVYIGADHRGFEQKTLAKKWLDEKGIEYEDVGAHELDPNDDYNDYAVKVARAVAKDEEARGILICGSGNGECIQANRFRRVRAINGLTPELAEMGRKHNDANVLCLAADFVPDPTSVLVAFFATEFLGDEKYKRRNEKLDKEV